MMGRYGPLPAPDPTPADRRPTLVAALFVLSGAAALVYQVAWQRILALHSGVGLYSVATIVAAFMAGLGLGSHLGGVWCARVDRRAALRIFAALELAIGIFGASSTAIYYDWLYPRAVGIPSPSLAGALLHLCALLPPTAAMGMSLPFLVRACVVRVESAGRTIGLLYSVNLFGAAAGALAAPWLLIPRLGLRGAVVAAALANAAAGLGAFALARGRLDRSPVETAVALPDGAAPDDRGAPSQPFSMWLFLYALSGFVALSLEIVWFRLMDVAVKSTAFTFGTVLAVYLAGNGIGSLVGALGVRRFARPLRAFLWCQCSILVLAGLPVVLVTDSPAETPVIRGLMAYWAQYDGFLLGRVFDLGALSRLYVVLPSALFLLPTALMGLSFPILQRAVHDDVRTSGRKVGALQAANILGCVAGSLVVGLGSLSALGTAGTLRALVGLGLVFAVLGARTEGRRFGIAAAALLGLVWLLPDQDRLWRRLHGLGSEEALLDEDATSVVAVAREDGARFRLSINGKGNSWLPFGGVHTVLGALPALIHPGPRDVAVIGLGSGDTAWAAACRSETESLTVFEISSPQPRVLARLAREEPLPDLRHFLADPRVRVVVADGRHALESEARRYDLIEVDALRPQSAGSGNLYSLEFFSACARRLKPGGVMCTWSPTPRVYSAFRRAFPHVLEADAGEVLVGSVTPVEVDRLAWRARLDGAVRTYLGSQNAAEVEARLERIRPAFHEGRARVEPNRDLWPRDEFVSPAADGPGSR